MKKITFQLLVAAFVLTAGSVKAQTNVLRIPSITGESVVFHHVNDIDITSFSWGVSIPLSGGNPGAPAFTDVTITKLLDKSSPTLALKCAGGNNLGTVTIFCTKSSAAGQIDYYKIALSTCVVTSDSVNSPPGSSVPVETITLHFSSIQWTYTPLDSSGNPQTPITTQYP